MGNSIGFFAVKADPVINAILFDSRISGLRLRKSWL
jgi:hypothetical protein